MPTPKKDESHDDFIKRCIPYVIDEGTAKDGKQAKAICESIWKKEKKENKDMGKNRVLLHLDVKLFGMEKLSEGEEFDDSISTLIVGDSTYNGVYFPTEELKKSFKSFDGVPININHSDEKIEDIVGYVKEPFIDSKKLRARTVFDSDTVKYDEVMGYIKSRFNAGDVPNLSIGVWLDLEEEELDNGEKRLTARNLDADHLGIVVHGACNPDDGCGIGMSYSTTAKNSYHIDTSWDSKLLTDNEKDYDIYLNPTVINEEENKDSENKEYLIKQILIEKIKKEGE